MTHLVDLTKMPYNLNKEDIQWVEKTISQMSLDEKIGQLFVNMGSSLSEEYLTDMVQNYHIAPFPPASVFAAINNGILLLVCKI